MANIAVTTTSPVWYITTGGALTLPYTLWPRVGPTFQPFCVSKMIWINSAGSAGNRVVITDTNGVPFVTWDSTGADFMTPFEWERMEREGAPLGAIITVFDAGELWVHL